MEKDGISQLLFISPLLAMPNQHGGCVYPNALLTEMHQRQIRIQYAWLGCPLGNGAKSWMRDPLSAPYVSEGWVRGTRKLGPFPIRVRDSFRLKKQEADFAEGERLPNTDEKQFIASLVRKIRPRAVLVDGTTTLPVLDALSSQERTALKVGVLTHNLNYRRTELYKTHNQPLDFFPMTREQESALLNRADFIVAIQPREAVSFTEMLPGKSVITVPMPMTPSKRDASLAKPGRCLFVGGLSGHNIAALNWLIADIWPRVKRDFPSAELAVAGTVGCAISQPVAGVQVLGPLVDLKPEYAASTLCLVPLQLGTGLKIKLVEAMSEGRAAVTTSFGAEGFDELERGWVSPVADEPEAFALKVVELLRSPNKRSDVVSAQNIWLEKNLAPSLVLAPLLAEYGFSNAENG